jgi:DNA helicase-2/ATP-dependent DNA helicase PcrA
MLVVAGAGTGKTKVIAHRIAYLVAAKRVQPSEILALTFTERAAAEMEARVDLLVPYGYTDMWISTFHAFGDRLFREFALELGLPDTAGVLSEPERVVFFRERLFRLPLRHFLPLGNPVRHLTALVRVTARAKDEGVSPEDYLAFARESLERAESRVADTPEDPDGRADLAQARRQLEVAQVYRMMDEELHAAGRIDFGDQILLALRLLREHPHVLASVRRRFHYILVDEFQDTNVVQWELLKLLAGDHRNITVVGDDDQSIYKFRGAAIGNILGFSDTYPDRSLAVLTRCYRAGQNILDAAYRLIQHNNPERLEVREGIVKRLRSTVESAGEVEQHRYDTIAAEADQVAARIRQLVTDGRALRDIAVLVRSNRDAAPFLAALAAAGIPHEFSGSRGLFQREEVGLCVSFLRAVTRPADSQSLFSLAASEVYQMPMADLVGLADIARLRHRTLHWVLRRVEEMEHGGEAMDGDDLESLGSLSEEGLSIARRLHRDLAGYAEDSRRRTTGELLYQFLSDTGYLAELTAAESLEAEERIRNIARFFDQITRYQGIALADRAHAFVDHLDLLIEAGDDPQAVEPDPDLEAVRVLTVHRAKGLEFPIVFVVNLVSQKFPTQRRGDAIDLPAALYHSPVASGDFHLAEERRLFYVAMTRARELLVLTSAADHGGVRQRKLSQFVVEALDLPAAGAAGPPTTAGAVAAIGRHASVQPLPPPALKLPSPDELLRLSATRIDTYRTCPLRYKYAHHLRMPAVPHHSQSYGSAMHSAIAHLLIGRLRGAPPSVAEVQEVLRDSWRSEGFLSREHEERRLAAGLRILERFHAEETSSPMLPAQVEKEFSFVHGKTRMDGRFDRVDLDPVGATVIDYKTSAVRDQAEADRRARKSPQLRIYALAYRHQAGVRPQRVELRFVESGLIGGAEPGEEELAEAEAMIEGTAAGIRAGSFEAHPSPQICGSCLYGRICPSAVR